MRIAHLSVLRSHIDGAGVTNQLRMENEAASRSSISWATELWDDEQANSNSPAFQARIPRALRTFIGRRYFIYRRTRELLKNHDYVLVRYTLVHLFDLMHSHCDAKNIIYVIHLPPSDIAGTLPKPISMFFLILERSISKWLFKRSKVIAAVVPELFDQYSGDSNLATKHKIVYPNGALPLGNRFDTRVRENSLRIGFISSEFYEWIGLDKLLDELERLVQSPLIINARFVIVGKISELQYEHIANLKNIRPELVEHIDRVPYAAMPGFLASLDCTLGAFALEKSGLSTMASLKVRESLMAGVPVYSGHPDAHIPLGFKFLKVGECDPVKIIRFAERHNSTTRDAVREASSRYIDKQIIMEKFVEQLKSFSQPRF